MNIIQRSICVLFLLFWLLGCKTSQDYSTYVAPSPVKAPSPSSTPKNIAITYDRLTKLEVSSGTYLIASPAFPKSQIENAYVGVGESVYLVTGDRDNAWLLVLYGNMLGWIPSIILVTGIGAIVPTTIEIPPVNSCMSYIGSLIDPGKSWTSNLDTDILVQGYYYSQEELEHTAESTLEFQIRETGEKYPAQIEHNTLESGGVLSIFTASIENIKPGQHINYHIYGIDHDSTPLQATFFADDCSNIITDDQLGQSNPIGTTPQPPISTLIIKITSSVLPPTIAQQESEFTNYSCPDKAKVKLRVGFRAVVSRDDVNLRSSPKVPNDWDENIIVVLHQSNKMTVIGGPTCAYDGTWWEVKTDLGYTGWIREFLPTRTLIEPIK